MALTDERKHKLIQIARYIEAHIDEKITLNELGHMVALSSSRLQRAFKALFGVTPKEYQDALRMGKFKTLLKDSDSVIDAVYASGFGSISRVYGEDTRNIGMTPKTYRVGGSGEIIHFAIRETVLGFMLMAATAKGVCTVQFSDVESELYTLLEGEYPKAKLIASNAQTSTQLDDWIDNPKAVRAVGTACGKNKIGVLIPCHRVLRGDGGLGGYRWGLARKQALLKKEKTHKPSQSNI